MTKLRPEFQSISSKACKQILQEANALRARKPALSLSHLLLHTVLKLHYKTQRPSVMIDGCFRLGSKGTRTCILFIS